MRHTSFLLGTLLCLMACDTPVRPFGYLPYGTWEGGGAALIVGDGRSLLVLPGCRVTSVPYDASRSSSGVFEAEVQLDDSTTAGGTMAATVRGEFSHLDIQLRLTLTTSSGATERYALRLAGPRPQVTQCFRQATDR